ncbi:NAD(P)H dehydrogenase (quinone) [Paraburkholderia fungorum]|uniref:NAD(P)H dehydrogenase (Quinone) n=1 Tax=Paraburkholderia fungorum TaxID=134537 RepID=A0A1H1K0W1_9BURK|nr:SDR family oxidoreductase [Paraburkholderia fungorum]SDR55495.1 NAD(P)H dehydrogenase (quinone) [Paraburkholderia fungorum]
MPTQASILITGAAGQLGRLTIEALLKRVPAAQIYALVRSDKAAADLSTLGVNVRIGDYRDAASLDTAFHGIDRVLLISSNDLGNRSAQHANVIDAARRQKVGLIAYTSLLHADVSKLGIAGEHRETEAALGESGVPYVLLRNGWYTENYAASIPAALAHNALAGSAGEGRISSAARADYAEAAAIVLSADQIDSGRIYELAGDDSYTLSEFAQEIATQTKKEIGYANLPESEFKAMLSGAGLPPALAELLADSDACAAEGALFDDSRALSKLLDRPTTSWKATITAALAD